ncbi:MAG TPA: glycosyltransferase, partial [Anaeromyxobacteraceae bacterium]|nr:glycosyltransferase [Anaeromyxobacteraceae bacterium]
SHAHVLQEMAWSDVFALIGWDEPFGVVFSEAAACSLPILLASDCGFNDVFRDGVHGFSTPPRDPAAAAERLEALLADPDRRRAMGRAAFNLWVSRLTWDAHAAQLASILRAAIA